MQAIVRFAGSTKTSYTSLDTIIQPKKKPIV